MRPRNNNKFENCNIKNELANDFNEFLNMTNYRPIAVLSIFSKIFGKAFQMRLLSFLNFM